jgi:hypothetical protein
MTLPGDGVYPSTAVMAAMVQEVMAATISIREPVGGTLKWNEKKVKPGKGGLRRSKGISPDPCV